VQACTDVSPHIRRIDEVGLPDVALVGGKAAHLGALRAAGLPVPDGFCVTTDAHRAHVAAASLTSARTGEARRAQVQRSAMPAEVTGAIHRAYAALEGVHGAGVAVAVRSSSVHEDGAAGSAAGQHDTFLQVVGADAVVDAVRRCWASRWSDRALAYLAARPAAVEGDSPLGVVVQVMVAADVAGVLFTVDPLRQAEETLVLSASWGLGTVVVSGAVVPDRWVVRRDPLLVVSRHPGRKDRMLAVPPGGDRPTVETVDADRQRALCLADAAVLEVCALGLRAEAAVGAPVEVEWAAADGQVRLLQARPLAEPAAPRAGRPPVTDVSSGGGAVLQGLGASAGVAQGTARVCRTLEDAARLRSGEVLVTRETDPTWTALFPLAAAVVTEVGGLASHAAVICREYGLPCVTDLDGACAAIPDGATVTVDGGSGAVVIAR